MLKKNEVHTVTITEINDLGYGISRIDGLIVFVASAVTGDIADVRLIKINKSYAVARIEKIIKPSRYRIKPDCNVSSKCGGCVYSHISYDYEKQLKTQNIKQAFESEGINLEISTIRHATVCERYRNKALYPVGNDLSIGFYRPKSNIIVENEDCLLQPEIFSDIVALVKTFLSDFAVSGYDRERNTGLVRHIYLRYGKATGEIMLCLVLNGSSLPREDSFVSLITSAFPEVVSIMINENHSKGSRVTGEKYRLLYGKDHIVDILSGVKLNIHPSSFYQVNHDASEILYEIVCNEAEAIRPKKILDLFCGIGSIGLAVRKRIEDSILYGYEIEKEAVNNALTNAKINSLSNCEFICEDLSKSSDRLTALLKECDLVILDPPRKGIDGSLCEKIIFSEIENIIYVSCDCRTLSRDVRFLCGNGYKVIKSPIPVDMFPRTAHVECVVLITRVKE